jgi:serine/threonine-protein kinase
MTGCPSADVLERLLADELSGTALADLQTHLQGCPVCQDTLERLTATPRRRGAVSLRSEEAFLNDLIQAPPALTIVPGTTAKQATPPRIAGYELLAELGRGASGVVYQARQAATGEVVALKVLRSRTLSNAPHRFRREVEALAWLNHPNLVCIREVGEWRGRSYLAMEYVAGGGLDRKLAAGPLSPGEAICLVAAVARGIHAAHERGIVHRDLKPGNILLAGSRESGVGTRESETGTGESATRGRKPASLLPTPDSLLPKIADFGLAKHLEDTESLTASGVIIGTPYYMAPEQAEGRARDVGPAADI